MPPGRKSTYKESTAAAVLEKIANGKSLRAISREDGMPAPATVVDWANRNESGFAERYARALAIRAEHMAEELLEIADDGTGDTWIDDDGNEQVNHDHIKRSVLRVDARKWLLSKMLPKKYGDASKIEVTGADGAPLFKAFVGVDPDKV